VERIIKHKHVERTRALLIKGAVDLRADFAGRLKRDMESGVRFLARRGGAASCHKQRVPKSVNSLAVLTLQKIRAADPGQ